MSDSETFILNVNLGKDTLHRVKGLTERCNTDQVEGREAVDELTAHALLDLGSAVACLHCKPFADAD